MPVKLYLHQTSVGYDSVCKQFAHNKHKITCVRLSDTSVNTRYTHSSTVSSGLTAEGIPVFVNGTFVCAIAIPLLWQHNMVHVFNKI